MSKAETGEVKYMCLSKAKQNNCLCVCVYMYM